jgi:hypothetical protein
MQIDAFGPRDERCMLTGKKIYYLEQQELVSQSTCVVEETVPVNSSADATALTSSSSDGSKEALSV